MKVQCGVQELFVMKVAHSFVTLTPYANEQQLISTEVAFSFDKLTQHCNS